MKDPAILALIFKALPGVYVRFDDPASMQFDTPSLRATLDRGELRLEFRQPVPIEVDALELATPLLRSWEIRSGLDRGRPAIQFEYLRPEYIDLAPDTLGPDKPIPVSRSETVAFESVLHHVATEYPEPPLDFVVDPDVEVLWQRYQMYKSGNEPLLTMAYFCFTVLTSLEGGRREIAGKLQIDESVLRKLSELTSIRGSRLTARKVSAQSTDQPLTRREEEWLDAAVRMLIRRLGELRAFAPIRPLGMTDLPVL